MNAWILQGIQSCKFGIEDCIDKSVVTALLCLVTLQEGSILGRCGGEAVKDALQPLQLLAADQAPPKFCAESVCHWI